MAEDRLYKNRAALGLVTFIATWSEWATFADPILRKRHAGLLEKLPKDEVAPYEAFREKELASLLDHAEEKDLIRYERLTCPLGKQDTEDLLYFLKSKAEGIRRRCPQLSFTIVGPATMAARNHNIKAKAWVSISVKLASMDLVEGILRRTACVEVWQEYEPGESYERKCLGKYEPDDAFKILSEAASWLLRCELWEAL